MDLMWWGVPIAACVGLAVCIGLALLWPAQSATPPQRVLANTARLTRLPAYAKAARRKTISAVVTIVLLLSACVGTALAAARPTGLPAPQRQAAADQPEDIMVCVGGTQSDPAVRSAMQYFAEVARGFGTERIGLTSANRRVIPLTRDYQYAAARFGEHAGTGVAPLASQVSYADYAPSVADVLAMCLTGFPAFDGRAGQRRSLIYVGPGSFEADPRPSLFTDAQVRQLAQTAGVQINAVTAGAGLPVDLANATGGRAYPETADTAVRLGEIRRNPPPVVPDADGVAARSPETPEFVVLAALLALAVVLAWPVVMRR